MVVLSQHLNKPITICTPLYDLPYVSLACSLTITKKALTGHLTILVTRPTFLVSLGSLRTRPWLEYGQETRDHDVDISCVITVFHV